ncbi:ribosomal-protein-alanine N-acetyltransferase [Roseivivax lentus]|uniref:Ribosomal-protein-alanine N-acetyltransferase n=1 Tax=Roseivivax lentus TaxID=633194 RepID=A0A1N7KY68_9RHOB|nr:GNAT family N-acetyltransferase [Roseivivax lentus]SIS66528.1 ribosomal-protein-alanine N-acetyltransferase [Roseivivax lentus]
MSPDAAAAILAAAYRHQRAWTAQEVAATLETPGARLFHTQGAVLIARLLPEEAEILALATDPARQRTGAAMQLLQSFHVAARSEGATRAFLEVAAANAPARALYTAAGYAEIGRRPRYYRLVDGHRDDAVVMQRALDEKSALTSRERPVPGPKSG